jgi:hypothetical protein
MIREKQPVGWPCRPVRAAGSRSDKKPRHARPIAPVPIHLRAALRIGGFIWVPGSAWDPTAARLCLANRQGNAERHMREAEPRTAARSQAEPGNEAFLLCLGSFDEITPYEPLISE